MRDCERRPWGRVTALVSLLLLVAGISGAGEPVVGSDPIRRLGPILKSNGTLGSFTVTAAHTGRLEMTVTLSATTAGDGANTALNVIAFRGTVYNGLWPYATWYDWSRELHPNAAPNGSFTSSFTFTVPAPDYYGFFGAGAAGIGQGTTTGGAHCGWFFCSTQAYQTCCYPLGTADLVWVDNTLPPPAFLPTPRPLAASKVETLGRWPYGPTRAVAADGDLAVFGNGAALVTLDISDPAAPVRLGEVDLGVAIEGVALASGVAYVAAGRAGVRVVDVADPTDPIEAFAFETTRAASDVTLHGDLAFVAQDDYVLLLDVTDPFAPVPLSVVEVWEARAVAVSGDVAFIVYGSNAGGGPTFMTVDIQDRLHPVPLTSIVAYGTAQDVVVTGGFAYLAMNEGGLSVVDVGNPASPAVVASVGTPGLATSLATSGDRVMVGDDEGWLHVVDVASPASPVVLGSFDTGGAVEDVAVGGGFPLLADRGRGLLVVDASDPAAPTQLAFVDTPGRSLRTVVDGDRGYVGGLSVIDLSAPSRPVEAGWVDVPGGSYDMALDQSRTFLVNAKGLSIVDVNQDDPVLLGSYLTPSYPFLDRVAVHGDVAYVGFTGGTGVRIIDVTSPSAPVHVGTINIPSGGLATGGKHLFVGRYDLRIFDITVPTAPVEIGSADASDEIRSVAVEGDVVAAGHHDSISVFDVSDPTSPVEVGALAIPHRVSEVSLTGNLAFVATSTGGLRIIDVSVPRIPVEVGFLETRDHATGVTAVGRTAYVSTYDSGLTIVSWDSLLFADGFESGDTAAWQ